MHHSWAIVQLSLLVSSGCLRLCEEFLVAKLEMILAIRWACSRDLLDVKSEK